jgi:hypothetical protein
MQNLLVRQVAISSFFFFNLVNTSLIGSVDLLHAMPVRLDYIHRFRELQDKHMFFVALVDAVLIQIKLTPGHGHLVCYIVLKLGPCACKHVLLGHSSRQRTPFFVRYYLRALLTFTCSLFPQELLGRFHNTVQASIKLTSLLTKAHWQQNDIAYACHLVAHQSGYWK